MPNAQHSIDFRLSKPSADRKPSTLSGLGTKSKSLKCPKWLTMANIATKTLDIAH